MSIDQSESMPKPTAASTDEEGETELFVRDNSALQQLVEARFRRLVEIWQNERPPRYFINNQNNHVDQELR